MQPSDDLVALFEVLRRTPAPADKARVIARAWRTIRGLSSSERRYLAREVGFDGAEELVEGLAARSGGAFAPAAVLESLAAARADGSFSVRGLIAGMKDPERREDLLAKGVDLVADALHGGGVEPEAPTAWTDGSIEVEVAAPETERDGEPDGPEVEPPVEVTDAVPVLPKLPPPPEPEPPAAPTEMPGASTDPEPLPSVEAPPEPSAWDELWDAPVVTAELPDHSAAVGRYLRPGTERDHRTERRPTSSAIRRLRQLRSGIDELRGRGVGAVRDRLDDFPEPWARRRALTALIEGGVPDEPGAALDLIEELDRPMDRSWCLSALARRGDLAGSDLARALAMLESPAARRRIERLAGG